MECAICFEEVCYSDGRNLRYATCCEKMFCEACAFKMGTDDSGHLDSYRPVACPYCRKMPILKDEATVKELEACVARSNPHPASLNMLGDYYRDGRGCQKDLQKAVKLHAAAAAQNYPPACCQLGHAYEKGLGVEQNDQFAARYYRKAADAGFAVAQGKLAVMHFQGRGVQKDDTLFAKWTLHAAEQGCLISAANLGSIYMSNTSGIPGPDTTLGADRSTAPRPVLERGGMNPIEAARWLEIAVEGGVGGDTAESLRNARFYLGCAVCRLHYFDLDALEGKPRSRPDGLSFCPRCHCAAYCSKECQKKHWPEHKTVCKQAKKAKDDFKCWVPPSIDDQLGATQVCVGVTVELHGLRSIEFNGLVGKVMSPPDDRDGRWGIKVDGRVKPLAIKEANLRVLQGQTAARA